MKLMVFREYLLNKHCLNLESNYVKRRKQISKAGLNKYLSTGAARKHSDPNGLAFQRVGVKRPEFSQGPTVLEDTIKNSTGRAARRLGGD